MPSRGAWAGKQAYRDPMKSKKRGKCKVLHLSLGMNNPKHKYMLLESCCAGKNLGVLVDTKSNISQHSALAAKKAHGTLRMHCQQVEAQHPEESYKDSE